MLEVHSAKEIIQETGYAPIILFVYNRPFHTKRTIEALKKNELADKSDLIIYSDASKNDAALLQVEEVRNYLKTVSGFKSVKIIERDANWGLAANIIDGVTDVVNQYGKIIVMEDDIVTSPAFLSFMNQALDFYQNENKVWHISGWNYPIETNGLGDAFFWRVMSCWGWATWADKWAHFEKNPQGLIDNWSAKQKYHFDLDGSSVFWHQVTANAEGKINTWAIFWYATIYVNGGACLNPSISYVDNIGHDGSGVHCGNTKDNNSKGSVLNTKSNIVLPIDINESASAVNAIKVYYKGQKKTLLVRVVNKLSRILFGKNIL